MHSAGSLRRVGWGLVVRFIHRIFCRFFGFGRFGSIGRFGRFGRFERFGRFFIYTPMKMFRNYL